MRRCSALSLKAENDIGSLTVMYSEALNGIITERHYARNVVLKGKSSSTTAMGGTDALSPYGRNNPSKNAWR